MVPIKKILNHKYFLWIILSLPAIAALRGMYTGDSSYGMLMHITGEFAGRFLAITLLITPLALLFPHTAIIRWLVRNRRFLGVAAFVYTLLHTVFYILEYPMAKLYDEFFEVAILTGWIAFFVFVPLAVTSTDWAVRKMGKNWKKLQRWVYLAGVMAFIHWALLGLAGDHQSMGAALFHFIPVMLLQVYRVWKQRIL